MTLQVECVSVCAKQSKNKEQRYVHGSLLFTTWPARASPESAERLAGAQPNLPGLYPSGEACPLRLESGGFFPSSTAHRPVASAAASRPCVRAVCGGLLLFLPLSQRQRGHRQGLAVEFPLSPAAVGLLTSTYLLSFAAMQVPVGVL